MSGQTQAAVMKVEVWCAACQRRHPHRRPGVVGVVGYTNEGVRVIVASRSGDRNGNVLPRSGSPAGGKNPRTTRMVWRKLTRDERTAVMDCPACPATPKVAVKRLRRDADEARRVDRRHILV